MRVSVLASGSSGNSTYIETEETSILIDAGISARRIKKLLSNLGKDIYELDGVFVTHEHTDHTYGMERLNRTFGVPVYANNATSEHFEFKTELFEKEVNLKDISVKGIPVSHDAADPYGYLVRENGTALGVFTDVGEVDSKLQKVVGGADGLVLETNHDVDMLLKGFYPYHLKQRILGNKGHLSNIDSALLIDEFSSSKLKTVFTAHLSQNNNSPELVEETFDKLINKNIKTIMTSQKLRTELTKI